METPDVPPIKGVAKMTALEMNSVHFNKNHTVLTPEVLASLTKDGGNNTKIKRPG